MIKCNKKSVEISLLWASAILSSAILGAPQFLTLILLPILAYTSVVILNKNEKDSSS